MIINSSLIKQVMSNGEVDTFCPWKVFTHYVTEDPKLMANYTSETLLKGCYFETLCLGSGVRGQIVDDLPRKQNGNKKVDHERIEMQHLNFMSYCREHDIIIDPQTNVQIPVYKAVEWDDEIIVKGEMDIFPVVLKTPNNPNVPAIVDLKLTADLSNTFGDYGWGDPTSMDHTQAKMYKYLTQNVDIVLNKAMGNTKLLNVMDKFDINNINFRFFYWVFEYKATLRSKWIEYVDTPTKRAELKESIRSTRNQINKYESLGWDKTVPAPENCKTCGVIGCQKRYIKDFNDEFQNYDQI